MQKKFQRIFTLILALILALGFLSMVAMTVSASENIPVDEMLRPVIQTQPASVTAGKGETVTISVEATNLTNTQMTYKWYYKDKADSQFQIDQTATGPDYRVTVTEAVDGRQVYCVVVNVGASKRTETATITMKKTAAITRQPVSVTAKEGETVALSVEATGDGLTYAWYCKEKDSASFVKTSVTTATYGATMSADCDGRQVYCEVTDKYGNAVKSDTVTLSMETIQHKHSYATTYTIDDAGHWYKCSGCSEKGSYAKHAFDNACDKTCSVCGYERNIAHTYAQKWESDKTNHWHVCSVCGDKADQQAHKPGAAATDTKAQTCTVCGYVIAPATGSAKPTEPTTKPTEPVVEQTDPVTTPTEPISDNDMMIDPTQPVQREEDTGLDAKLLLWLVPLVAGGMIVVIFAMQNRKKEQ